MHIDPAQSPLLQFIATKMRESDVWKNASDSEFDNAMEGMEKLVMNKLYDLSVPSHTLTRSPSLPLAALSLHPYPSYHHHDQSLQTT